MNRSFFSSHAVADLPVGGIVDVPLAQTGEGIAECELLKWFVQEVSERSLLFVFMSLHLLASSSSSCFFLLLKSLYVFLDVSSMSGCNCQWLMAFSLYSLFETIDALFPFLIIDALFPYFQIVSSIFCIFQDAYRCKVLCCFWFEFCLPRFVFGLSNMYY